VSDSIDKAAPADLTEPATPRFNVSLQDSEPAREREGLPRSYRMRAERHYVEQISGEGGHPVRMLPVSALETASSLEHGAELRALIESIRAHGIVHPLLVRRQRDRYQVIAGRKRLAAAHTLRLSAIPCIVRDVSSSEVSDLADADNLSAAIHPAQQPRDLSMVRRLATQHLHRVLRAAEMPIGEADGALDGCSVDMLKAHATRARFLLDALEVLDTLPPAGAQSCAVAPVLDEVVRRFSSEAALRRVVLRVDIEGYYQVPVDARHLTTAVEGALIATQAVLRDAPAATVVLRAADHGPGRPTIEVAQADRAIPQAVLAAWLNETIVDHGDCSAAIAAQAARAVADHYGGSIEFTASAGTRLAMTFRAAEK